MLTTTQPAAPPIEVAMPPVAPAQVPENPTRGVMGTVAHAARIIRTAPVRWQAAADNAHADRLEALQRTCKVQPDMSHARLFVEAAKASPKEAIVHAVTIAMHGLTIVAAAKGIDAGMHASAGLSSHMTTGGLASHGAHMSPSPSSSPEHPGSSQSASPEPTRTTSSPAPTKSASPSPSPSPHSSEPTPHRTHQPSRTHTRLHTATPKPKSQKTMVQDTTGIKEVTLPTTHHLDTIWKPTPDQTKLTITKGPHGTARISIPNGYLGKDKLGLVVEGKGSSTREVFVPLHTGAHADTATVARSGLARMLFRKQYKEVQVARVDSSALTGTGKDEKLVVDSTAFGSGDARATVPVTATPGKTGTGTTGTSGGTGGVPAPGSKTGIGTSGAGATSPNASNIRDELSRGTGGGAKLTVPAGESTSPTASGGATPAPGHTGSEEYMFLPSQHAAGGATTLMTPTGDLRFVVPAGDRMGVDPTNGDIGIYVGGHPPATINPADFNQIDAGQLTRQELVNANHALAAQPQHAQLAYDGKHDAYKLEKEGSTTATKKTRAAKAGKAAAPAHAGGIFTLRHSVEVGIGAVGATAVATFGILGSRALSRRRGGGNPLPPVIP
jgi:hypothetical protein